jgi:hypothetical protein
MKDSIFTADGLPGELAATPMEVALSLRLLKAFLSLPPEQRPEIIEWLEQRVAQQPLPPHGERLLS